MRFWAGCTFFRGFTPSHLPVKSWSAWAPAPAKGRRTGVFLQMEDEIAGLGAVVGASLAGRKCMTRHIRPGLFPDAGAPGVRAAWLRAPMVIVNVNARRPEHRHAHLPPPRGDVQQARWGHSRRPPHHRALRLHGAGVPGSDHLGLQFRRKIPYARHSTARRGHRPTPAKRSPSPFPRSWEIYSRVCPLGTTPNGSSHTRRPFAGLRPMPPIGSGYRIHYTGRDPRHHGLPHPSAPEEVEARHPPPVSARSTPISRIS